MRNVLLHMMQLLHYLAGMSVGSFVPCKVSCKFPHRTSTLSCALVTSTPILPMVQSRRPLTPTCLLRSSAANPSRSISFSLSAWVQAWVQFHSLAGNFGYTLTRTASYRIVSPTGQLSRIVSYRPILGHGLGPMPNERKWARTRPKWSQIGGSYAKWQMGRGPEPMGPGPKPRDWLQSSKRLMAPVSISVLVSVLVPYLGLDPYK